MDAVKVTLLNALQCFKKLAAKAKAYEDANTNKVTRDTIEWWTSSARYALDMWSKVGNEFWYRYHLNDAVGIAEESSSFVAAHDSEKVASEQAISRPDKSKEPRLLPPHRRSPREIQHRQYSPLHSFPALQEVSMGLSQPLR